MREIGEHKKQFVELAVVFRAQFIVLPNWNGRRPSRTDDCTGLDRFASRRTNKLSWCRRDFNKNRGGLIGPGIWKKSHTGLVNSR